MKCLKIQGNHSISWVMITQLNAAQALEKSKQKDTLVIDVREWEEIREGMVKGAIWVPLSALAENDAQARQKIEALSKEQTLLVYCRSGGRSGQVAAMLHGAGYQAINIGGFSSLAQAGFETHCPANPPA